MGATIGVEVRERHPDILIKLLNHIILAERMTLPIIGEEDPSQVRMPLEPNAEEVVRLSLVPVGCAPEQGHRGKAWALTRQLHLEHDLMHEGHGLEMIHHAEVFPRSVVHTTQAHEI